MHKSRTRNDCLTCNHADHHTIIPVSIQPILFLYTYTKKDNFYKKRKWIGHVYCDPFQQKYVYLNQLYMKNVFMLHYIFHRFNVNINSYSHVLIRNEFYSLLVSMFNSVVVRESYIYACLSIGQPMSNGKAALWPQEVGWLL